MPSHPVIRLNVAEALEGGRVQCSPLVGAGGVCDQLKALWRPGPSQGFLGNLVQALVVAVEVVLLLFD